MLIGIVVIGGLTRLVWPTVRARFEDMKYRPIRVELDSLKRSEDARIEKALTKYFPAFRSVREKTPVDATVSVFVPLDDERRLAINGMTHLLYPRKVDWYAPLRDFYLAHPERLNDRVYTLSLTADETIPMLNWFDEIDRGSGFVLYHYRGAPK